MSDAEKLDPTTENILSLISLLIPIAGAVIGLVLLVNKPKSAAKIFAFALGGFALAFILFTCTTVALIGAGA